VSGAIVPVELAAKIRGDLEQALEPHLEAKRSLYDSVAALAAKFEIADPDSMKLGDEFLKEILRERDGLEEVRKAGPGALDSIVRGLNAKFKPLRDKLDVAAANLKNAIGTYVVAERRKQEEAYQAAALAHAEGKHSEAQQALASAVGVQTTAVQGTSVREVWAVKRIAADLLPREWLVPDEARIAAHARTTPIDTDPTPIPGVVFERVPAVSARR
jgi:hypothetical protein